MHQHRPQLPPTSPTSRFGNIRIKSDEKVIPIKSGNEIIGYNIVKKKEEPIPQPKTVTKNK